MASARTQLTSALTRRVADGVLRRTAQLPGDLFVELRLYNTNDIRGLDPKVRWEKALVALKYQLSADSQEVVQLHKFLKNCKDKFTDEGTFYADKKYNN